MEKTLNDRIEEYFQGVVFIIFSFAVSLVLLACRPVYGFVILAKRLRSRSRTQIRPYAFAFFSIVLIFFMPSIIDAFAPSSPGLYQFQVHDSDHPVSGALGRAYEQTTQKIETKAATAIIVAAVTGVAALHLGAIASGLPLMRLRARRQTWRNSLFFVGGLQIVLLVLATIIDHFDVPPPTTEMEMLSDLLRSPRTLIYDGDVEQLCIEVARVALLGIMLLVPFGVARRYAPRVARSFQFDAKFNWLWAVLLLLVIDFVVLGSFGAAAYVADEVQPRVKPQDPFSIPYLNCEVQEKADKWTIVGDAIVRAATNGPWDFEENDFQMLVAADRTDKDPRPQRPSPVISSQRILGGPLMKISFSAVSPNLGSPPFLLQAGQAALIHFEVDGTSRIDFLRAHPKRRTCILHYINDKKDYHVGAIGALNVEDK